MNFKLSQKAVTSIHVKYSKKIQELRMHRRLRFKLDAELRNRLIAFTYKKA